MKTNERRRPSPRRHIEAAMHVLIWMLILGMPFLSANASGRTFGESVRMFPLPFFAGIVFYVNYFFLIKRFFFRKKLVSFFISNILLYAICIVSLEATRTMSGPPPFVMENLRRPGIPPDGFMERRGFPPSAGMILRAFITFAMTTGISVAIQTTKQWFGSEESRKELEREHLKSELANLKSQLNPHFFFNTLNNIYALIMSDQQKAQSAVHHLSKLMRYLLYETNEKFVPLNKEINFLHHYLDLMKLRVASEVVVQYCLPKDSIGYQIAPLLFISLIENSFKHGISLTQPSSIEMEMQVSIEQQLTFRIKNTRFPKNESDRSGSGIGLDNLKRRLALLYPERHSLDIQTSDKEYVTTLTLLL